MLGKPLIRIPASVLLPIEQVLLPELLVVLLEDRGDCGSMRLGSKQVKAAL